MQNVSKITKQNRMHEFDHARKALEGMSKTASDEFFGMVRA